MSNRKMKFFTFCGSSGLNYDDLLDYLKNGANPNKKNHYNGETPFHIICRNEKITFRIISLVLQYEANPNKKNYDGETPFYYFCMNARITFRMLKLMLKNKAKCNSKRDAGMTPFHILCMNSSLTFRMLKLMLQHKADLNYSSFLCGTPFYSLLEHEKHGNNKKMVKLMLKNKAKCKQNPYMTFLDLNLDVDIMRLLLKQKINVNYKNYIGETALWKNTKVENLKLLLEHKANPNIKDMYDETVIFYLCNQGKILYEMYNNIIINEKDIFQNEDDMKKLLETREEEEDALLKRMKILLDFGADITISNRGGEICKPFSRKCRELFLMYTHKHVDEIDKAMKTNTLVISSLIGQCLFGNEITSLRF